MENIIAFFHALGKDYLGFFNTISDGNAMMAGLLATTVSGGLLFFARSLPKRIYQFIKIRTTTTMHFDSGVNDFHIVYIEKLLKELTENAKVLNFRHISVRRNVNANGTRYNKFTLGYGSFFTLYKGHLIYVSRSIKENQNSDLTNESLSITLFGRSHNVFRNLINKAYPEVKLEKDEIVVRKFSGGSESSYNSVKATPFEELALNDETRKDFLEVLATFNNDEERYHRLGLAYRNTYLLHGKPGNGKTSTVKAIARLTNRELMILNAGDLTNATLSSVSSMVNAVAKDIMLESYNPEKMELYASINLENMVLNRSKRKDIVAEQSSKNLIPNMEMNDLKNQKHEDIYNTASTHGNQRSNTKRNFNTSDNIRSWGITQNVKRKHSMYFDKIENGKVIMMVKEKGIVNIEDEKSNGTIVVIEDFDSNPVFHKRKEGESKTAMGGDENSRSPISLDGLLNFLDGVIPLENCIVILTTNHLEMLDPAIYRPGRVDRLIELPDIKAIHVKEHMEQYYPFLKEMDLPWTDMPGSYIHSLKTKTFSNPEVLIPEMLEKISKGEVNVNDV